jgi:hypothetical protein
VTRWALSNQRPYRDHFVWEHETKRIFALVFQKLTHEELTSACRGLQMLFAETYQD